MAIEIQTQDLADRIENAAVQILQGYAASEAVVAKTVQGVFSTASQYFNTHSLAHGHRVTIESRVRERIAEPATDKDGHWQHWSGQDTGESDEV